MAWETPKTDWNGAIASDGTYIGDRFNAVDFNRIKNNLDYLRDLAIKIYKEFNIVPLGEDRGYEHFFYADEINQLEENLKTINNNTFKKSYGVAPVYVDNGHTMHFTELNRLESAILDLYNRLNHQAENRRTLVWNFGIKGGL
jgi:hypothetical protein